MSLFSASGPSLGDHARSTLHDGAPWVQRLARLGYAAKGVVYLVVGALAVQAAYSPGMRPQDSEGALSAILRQPLGVALLGVVALGLAGYVLWRLVQALLDPEHKGTGAKGVAVRTGYLLSALVHAGLTVEAVRLLLGSSRGGGREPEDWTAAVLAQPMGWWLVAAAGAGIIAFGLFELYRAAAVELSKRLDLGGVSADTRRRIVYLGRAGLAARGIVFGIIGWFVVQAALHSASREVQGLGEALRTVREQSHGRWLLGGVALGLAAYGAFLLVKARYRRIRPA